MVFTPVAYIGVRSTAPNSKAINKSKICDISSLATVKIFGNDAADFSEVAEYFDNFSRYYIAMTTGNYGTGYISTKSSTVEMVQD